MSPVWGLDEALRFARHFSPDDFDYPEEPVKTFPELVRFSQNVLENAEI